MSDEKMNLKEFYNFIPNANSFINVSLEFTDIAKIIPEFLSDNNEVICLYDICEKDMCECLKIVKETADVIKRKLVDTISLNEMWDIEIKPIFLFDTQESLLLFYDYANMLDEDNYYDMIDEMQRKYNVPWSAVTLLIKKHTQDIIEYYTRRFFA